MNHFQRVHALIDGSQRLGGVDGHLGRAGFGWHFDGDVANGGNLLGGGLGGLLCLLRGFLGLLIRYRICALYFRRCNWRRFVLLVQRGLDLGI